MRSMLCAIIIFNLTICYSQSCEQRLNNLAIETNKIQTCEQLSYFNNVTFSKSVAEKFGNECAFYISDNREKFYAIANKLKEIAKSLNCGGNNNNAKSSNTKKLKDDYIHYTPDGRGAFLKRETLKSRCFHTGGVSADALYAGNAICNDCKIRLTVAIKEAGERDYKLLKRYTGEEDVDENGNIVNNSANQTNQISSGICPAPSPPNAQQQAQNLVGIINQYKQDPIEFDPKKGQGNSNISNDDKTKLVKTIEDNAVSLDNFDENDIDKLLDIKEEVITKPIFDTYYYSGFSDAIYKTAEEGESAILLEDVAGYSFDVTFTVKASGFIENIRFQNETGVGATPKMNQTIKTIIYTLSAKGLWNPATKNKVKINDDVVIEIDVDRYLKAYYYRKNLKKDIAAIEYKEKKDNGNKIELTKDHSEDVKADKSYYQKFIDFKNKLMNDTNESDLLQTSEANSDKSTEITEAMENDAKKGLLKLLANPNVSMAEVRSYISNRIKSVSKGLKKMWEEKLAELDEMMLKIKL